MRFLIDMPLSPDLANWLGGNGHDAVHAGVVGLSCAADADIIKVAREQDRIVVTADLDYPRLLALSAAIGPSLILFRGGNWNERDVEDRLARMFASMSSETFERCILVVERDRVRRRALPI